MEAHTPSAGSAIDGQLRQVLADLDHAARLDGSEWNTLDQAGRSFITALRAGHTPGQNLVVQVTNGCQRAAPTPPPTG